MLLSDSKQYQQSLKGKISKPCFKCYFLRFLIFYSFNNLVAHRLSIFCLTFILDFQIYSWSQISRNIHDPRILDIFMILDFQIYSWFQISRYIHDSRFLDIFVILDFQIPSWSQISRYIHKSRFLDILMILDFQIYS